MDSLPIIDIAGLVAADPARSAEAGRQIRQACREVGFFYVTGHGVAAAVIADAAAAAWAFFRQAPAAKADVAVNRYHRGFNALGDALMRGAARPDYKEFFQIGLELGTDDPDVIAGQPLRGPNQWPEAVPAFRPAFTDYFAAMTACGRALLGGVALGLGRPVDFFRPHYHKPLQRTQAVYYPPQPEALGDQQFGVAPHTDFGCITVLWQDDVGGLEVRTLAGDWIAAPPIPGTLVINVGDLLARWTNDRFRSTEHRVVNRSGRERLSIATFYDPTFTATVDPRALLDDGEPAAFEPISAGAHITGRINASFGYRRS